jgi:hypothetical protein
MRAFTLMACVAVGLCGWLGWSGPAHADGRPAQEILAAIDKTEIPRPDPEKVKTKEGRDEYLAKRD